MSRRTVMTVIMGLMTGAFVHAAAPVWVIDLDQVIGASSARYLSDSLEEASASDVPLVVLRIDTPGGWMDSTRDIVKDIFMSVDGIKQIHSLRQDDIYIIDVFYFDENCSLEKLVFLESGV